MGDNKAFFVLAWCKNNQISWLQKTQFGHLAVPEFVFSPHSSFYLGSFFVPILFLIFCVCILVCYFHCCFQDTHEVLLTTLCALKRWTTWSKQQKSHTPMKKPYTSTQDIKISRHTWTQNLPGGTGRSDKLTGRPALWALMASWYCC